MIFYLTFPAKTLIPIPRHVCLLHPAGGLVTSVRETRPGLPNWAVKSGFSHWSRSDRLAHLANEEVLPPRITTDEYVYPLRLSPLTTCITAKSEAAAKWALIIWTITSTRRRVKRVVESALTSFPVDWNRCNFILRKMHPKGVLITKTNLR